MEEGIRFLEQPCGDTGYAIRSKPIIIIIIYMEIHVYSLLNKDLDRITSHVSKLGVSKK